MNKFRQLAVFTLVLKFSILPAQHLATVFIDTCIVTSGKDTLRYQVSSKAYFLSIKRKGEVILYKNDTLSIKHEFSIANNEYSNKIMFTEADTSRYTYLVLLNSVEIFIYNKLFLPSPEELDGMEFEICGGYGERQRVQVESKSDSAHPDLYVYTVVRLYNEAPEDTFAYQFPMRQGAWLSASDGCQKIRAIYINDKKEGKTTIYYKDGASIDLFFKNGIRVGEGNMRVKNLFQYFRPRELVNNDCE
ncbi:MAG TPA: hypothetical protein VI112_05060 [Bacteroidia bacterium]|jgi:hypothetical protein